MKIGDLVKYKTWFYVAPVNHKDKRSWLWERGMILGIYQTTILILDFKSGSEVRRDRIDVRKL